MEKKKKRDLMPTRIKRAKERLKEVCHDYIRRRDSDEKDKIAGKCFDCGLWAEGADFQAGHFETSGGHGVVLRYHPDNIHGQKKGCNMKERQEIVKINYTMKMLEKYGRERLDKIRALKNKSVRADILWYEKMIELYEEGNEHEIIDFLEK